MNFDIADFSYSRQRSTPRVAQSRHFTIKVRGQTIGIPVDCVKTIFNIDNLTRVPLAPPEVAGLVNVRGRIVTALYLDRCLWLDKTESVAPSLAVGIERQGEEYALIVDETDDVVTSNEADRMACPAHVDPRLAELVGACYRVDDSFLTILDVDAMLWRVGRSSETMRRDGRRGVQNKGANA